MASGVLGFLGSLLGLNAGDPTIDAANKNKTLLSGLQTQGQGVLDAGNTAAKGYLQQASDLYAPLAQEGQQAGQLYSDALGVNGAAGNTRATAAYQTSPGYDFTRDQALQAVDRNAAAHGLSSSGNWIGDTERTASGLADADYSGWLSQLGSPNTAIGSAVGSEAGALGNQANQATGAATSNLGFLGDLATGGIAANNQAAEGQTANDQGLSNLFGTALGGLTGLATKPLGGTLLGKMWGYGAPATGAS